MCTQGKTYNPDGVSIAVGQYYKHSTPDGVVPGCTSMINTRIQIDKTEPRGEYLMRTLERPLA